MSNRRGTTCKGALSRDFQIASASGWLAASLDSELQQNAFAEADFDYEFLILFLFFFFVLVETGATRSLNLFGCQLTLHLSLHFLAKNVAKTHFAISKNKKKKPNQIKSKATTQFATIGWTTWRRRRR